MNASARRHGTPARGAGAAAFTFVEMMVVVVIVGILAAVVIPRFGGVAEDARSAAARSAVEGVRAAVAGHRTKTAMAGAAAYPTLKELTTPGRVVQGELPANPYNGLATAQSVSRAQASRRDVVNEGAAGWNYFVDNAGDPPTAVFYLNSGVETTVPAAGGGVKRANQL